MDDLSDIPIGDLRMKSVMRVKTLYLHRESEEDKEKVRNLFAQAAALEEKIGDVLAEQDNWLATISWAEAGDCYKCAGDYDKAIMTYRKILISATKCPTRIPTSLVENTHQRINELELFKKQLQ